MTALPDAIFVVDVGFESGAVVEATKLGIPIIGVVDTNNSTENIAYVIPGNDDSSRAIRLYAREHSHPSSQNICMVLVSIPIRFLHAYY